MVKFFESRKKPDLAIDLGTANTRIMTPEGWYLMSQPYAASPVKVTAVN